MPSAAPTNSVQPGDHWTATGSDALREELDALWDRYVALSDQKNNTCRALVQLVAVTEKDGG